MVPSNRLTEMRIRHVAVKLQLLGKLQNSPLSVHRERNKRILGSCRDYAVLMCATLRQKTIPARVRYGFATYFGADFYTDHVICEYWSKRRGRWIRADPQVDDNHRNFYGIDFDTSDLPPGCFLAAGELWSRFRDGKVDPNRVGLDSRLNARGMEFLSSSLVRDLAGLNKTEVLCIDAWGLADKRNLSESDLDLLDDLAENTVESRFRLARIRAYFLHDPRLRVSKRGIKCYTPSGQRS